MKTRLLAFLCSLSFTCQAQIPAGIDTNRLMAYYSFTGNSKDDYKYGYNGTAYNVDLAPDRFGNINSAYKFHGRGNSYIQIPVSNFTPDSFSICVWAKCDTIIAHAALIASRIGMNQITSLGFDDKSHFFYVAAPLGSYDVQYTRNGIDDTSKWHFLVGVFTGDSLFLYVDDTLRNKYAQTFAPKLVTPFKIGWDDYDSSRGFVGSIDDIGIWRRALRPSEIDSMYKLVISSPTTATTTAYPDKIEVFPNPTNSTINIKGQMQIDKIELLDIAGQVRFSHRAVNQIDVSTLPNGVYFLRIDNVYITKIIKGCF